MVCFQDIGDDFGDEDYGGGRRKGGKRTRMPRQSMGGGPRKTRKSRAKPVSIDDDYDQVEPTHFCGLCGKVNRLLGCLGYDPQRTIFSTDLETIKCF